MNLLFKIFGGNYDDLWKAIIRPNRDIYTKEDLGPIKFEIGDKCYKRTDIELINKNCKKLMCSFWEPFDEERETPLLPCLIYLHGNSSSRCEVYQEISYLLNKNITVFSFDFCGCGQSDGDYISLGYHEKKDVHCVIEYLIKSKKVSKIGLWGRSMGAVTAIMYANEHPSLIDAMVLDSGFYSLKMLINELIDSKIKLPKFIYEKVLNMVKQTIKEKANFDLDNIEPYIYAKNCLVPAFFCHGNDDDFVLPHHSQDLFNEYKSLDKYLEIVKGGHNSPRPKKLIIKICNFLKKRLNDDGEFINEYDKIMENDNSDEDFEEEEEYSLDKNNFNDFKEKLNKNNNIINIKNNKNIFRKEKSEENASSSSSSNKKRSINIYRKKLVKKEILNIMKVKSNAMSQHFYNYNNKNNNKYNNMKLSSIFSNVNNSCGKIKSKNSFFNIILKTPYIKKNNKINKFEKTYTSNFYIKNLNGANFIQNNFYMTNNSYYKRPNNINYTNIINKDNIYYYSSNKNSDKNIFKTKEKMIYKRKLRKKILFNVINRTQKK